MSGVLQRSTIKIIGKIALTFSKLCLAIQSLCGSASLRDKTLLSTAVHHIPLHELFGAALSIHGGRDDAAGIACPFPTGK
jgi:hypothetical protein